VRCSIDPGIGTGSTTLEVRDPRLDRTAWLRRGPGSVGGL